MQRPPQGGTLAALRIAERFGHRDPARPDLPQHVSASCHLGCARTPVRMRARVRRVGHQPRLGQVQLAPSIQARAPVHKATVTAVWQLAIFPSAPQY